MDDGDNIVVQHREENLAPAPPASGAFTISFRPRGERLGFSADIRHPDGREETAYISRNDLRESFVAPSGWDTQSAFTASFTEAEIPDPECFLVLPDCRPESESVLVLPCGPTRRRKVKEQAGRASALRKKCNVRYHHELSHCDYKVYEQAMNDSLGGTTKSKRDNPPNGNLFYASLRNLAHLLNMSERQVLNSIKRLVELGLLKVPSNQEERKSPFGSNCYVVLVHDEWVAENPRIRRLCPCR